MMSLRSWASVMCGSLQSKKLMHNCAILLLLHVPAFTPTSGLHLCIYLCLCSYVCEHLCAPVYMYVSVCLKSRGQYQVPSIALHLTFGDSNFHRTQCSAMQPVWLPLCLILLSVYPILDYRYAPLRLVFPRALGIQTQILMQSKLFASCGGLRKNSPMCTCIYMLSKRHCLGGLGGMPLLG